MRALASRPTVCLSFVLAASCTADGYARRAERDARAILDDGFRATLERREETALQPLPAVAVPELPEEPRAVPAERQVLDLRTTLVRAFDGNRAMLAQREGLEIQALALRGARHEFAPQLGLSLGYLFGEQPGAPDSNGASAALSASQILATGARLSLEASSATSALEGESPAHDSVLAATLVQPLLRGGGHAVTHEPLIQAERNLVYALRDFELFREDFTIDVARRYYDLVNRKQSMENRRRNMESNEFARRQAEALFAVGRANELDVLRARRSELVAKNGLLEAEEKLELALDDFRIFLGLPSDQPIDVEADAPPFAPVAYDLGSALEVARANRLDLLNRREQLEDVERGLALARNSLLPDLSLSLGTSYATDERSDLFGSDLGRTDTSVALTLSVPLDRVRERNSYRTAQLGLARARRDLEEFEDQLRVSIQGSFRELERRGQSLEIQRQIIVDQTKNLRIAELRFERGEIPNRDVVEANQALLEAQNALIDEQVAYEIARLQLLRDLGILFIDETGMWKG
jgi:outer membrane protein TolC